MMVGGVSGQAVYGTAAAYNGAAVTGPAQAGETAAPAVQAEAVAAALPGAVPSVPDGDTVAVARGRAFAKDRENEFDQACQTCKNRKYQDGSDDSGVSFQTPQHIDPGSSASVVAGHEMEHVMRERFDAESEGGKVVMQTVQLHGDICPECGRFYIAGGTTRTVTRGGGENSQNGQQGTQAPEQQAG